MAFPGASELLEALMEKFNSTKEKVVENYDQTASAMSAAVKPELEQVGVKLEAFVPELSSTDGKIEGSKQSDDEPKEEEDSELKTKKEKIKEANASTDKNFDIDSEHYSERMPEEKINLKFDGKIKHKPQEYFSKIDTEIWEKDNNEGVDPTARPAYQKNEKDTKKAFGYASPSALQDRKMIALSKFRDKLNILQELRQKTTLPYPFNITDGSGEEVITKNLTKVIPEITAEGITLKNASWDMIQSKMSADSRELIDAGHLIENQLANILELSVTVDPLIANDLIEKNTREVTTLLENYETLTSKKAAFYDELIIKFKKTFATKTPDELKFF